MRNIEKQIAKAEKIIGGKLAVQKAKFISMQNEREEA